MRSAVERDAERASKAKRQAESRDSKGAERDRSKGRAHRPVVAAATGSLLNGVMILFQRDADKENAKGERDASPFKELVRLNAPARVCTIAVQAALEGIAKPEKLGEITGRIGVRLENELIWRGLERANYSSARRQQKRINTWVSEKDRNRALREYAAYRDLVPPGVDLGSDFQRKSLGARFLLYLVKLGVFEKTTIKPRTKYTDDGKNWKRPANGVRLTSAFQEKMGELASLLLSSASLSWPLIRPPIPWTAPEGGGFHNRENLGLAPFPLVKRACFEQRRLMTVARMQPVYDAVNALQSVPWRINRNVYEVACELLADEVTPGIQFRSVPTGTIGNPWKRAKAVRKNEREAAKLTAFQLALDTARRDLREERLYFVHQLDFRGRAFAEANYLTPQGADLERSLLEFAHGDPLDEEGVKWLAIHLANCWGIDKVSFKDRERWAYEKEAMILRVAANPRECTDWHDADPKKRWQFLAACFAWKDYRENGLGAVCRLPVMLDGTCSGLQHFSALMLDRKTGSAVNLTKRDKPGDLYTDVANDAWNRLAGTEEGSVERGWTEWTEYGRKIVKQAVMVLPYGAGYSACEEYVREAVEEYGEPAWLTQANSYDAYKALVGAVWAAMNGRVSGPKAAMKWVRRVAQQWGEAAPAVPVQWTAPTGFPVVCAEYVRKPSRDVEIELWGTDRTYIGTWGRPAEELDWKAIRSAAVPNFIHSLDAAHLMAAVNRARAEGITKITTVHDAFGTTPARIGRLAEILREEFAKLYTPNQFEILLRAAKAAGVDVDDPPARDGGLDIRETGEALYLFS